MSNELPPPVCLAMILCDHVWKDPMTGKKSILGTFSDVSATKFPAEHPELCLYIALTEGHGTPPLRIRIVDVDEAHEPIFEANESIHFCNPRSVSEATMRIEYLQFPRPGEYAIQLFVNGGFIAERRLVVRPAAEQN